MKELSPASQASAQQSLKPRPDPKETAISRVEGRCESWPAGRDPKRTEHGNGPPHRGEGRGPGQKPAILLRMEASEDLGTIDRTADRRIAGIQELDRPAPVEASHECNLALTQRATAVEPDGDLGVHDRLSIVKYRRDRYLGRSRHIDNASSRRDCLASVLQREHCAFKATGRDKKGRTRNEHPGFVF